MMAHVGAPADEVSDDLPHPHSYRIARFEALAKDQDSTAPDLRIHGGVVEGGGAWRRPDLPSQ